MIGPRLFPAFSAAFGVIYLMCMHFNIYLFSYYPKIGQFRTDAPKDAGPAMYFYAWLVNALFGAIAVALVAAVIPQAVVNKIWSGWTWVIPTAMLFLSMYYMRIWFVH